jgi:hypothetical protein
MPAHIKVVFHNKTVNGLEYERARWSQAGLSVPKEMKEFIFSYRWMNSIYQKTAENHILV